MDHYADDLAALTAHLDLHDAVHIGHSAGGGEVARYAGRPGESRVAKVVVIISVLPYVMAAEGRPDSLQKSVFDDFRTQLATHRAEFYQAVTSGSLGGQSRHHGARDGQARRYRHAQDLSRLPAGDADPARRRDQP
jgi:non-heme chloroperoxidase